MKKVTAYKCEFCDKLLNTYSGMKRHESICFKNPETKSCIKCKGLSQCSAIRGERLGDREESILRYEVEGTYEIICNTDPESDGADFKYLNEEYRYLYDADIENYCTIRDVILKKLQTNCESFKF